MHWVILVLLISVPARAELNKRNLGIVLGGLPVAYFHEVVYHETSHLLMVKTILPEARITHFAPYPHKYNNRFYIGAVEYSSHQSELQDSVIKFAPYMVDITAFTISDVFLSRMNPREPGSAVLYTLGILAPYISFAMNYVVGSDWKGIRQNSNHIYFDVIGGVALVVGTWRTIHHGIRVLRR